MVYDLHASSMTKMKYRYFLTMHDELMMGYSRNNNCILGYHLMGTMQRPTKGRIQIVCLMLQGGGMWY